MGKKTPLKNGHGAKNMKVNDIYHSLQEVISSK